MKTLYKFSLLLSLHLHMALETVSLLKRKITNNICMVLGLKKINSKKYEKEMCM